MSVNYRLRYWRHLLIAYVQYGMGDGVLPPEFKLPKKELVISTNLMVSFNHHIIIVHLNFNIKNVRITFPGYRTLQPFDKCLFHQLFSTLTQIQNQIIIIWNSCRKSNCICWITFYSQIKWYVRNLTRCYARSMWSVEHRYKNSN